jgi:hypothetical protein
MRQCIHHQSLFSSMHMLWGTNNSGRMNKFANMNILEIGDALRSHYTTRIHFVSNKYFLDADILVMDFDAIDTELYQLMTNIGLGNKHFTEKDYAKFIGTVENRKDELAKYFKDGGNLFVLHAENTVRKFNVNKEGEMIEEIFDVMDILDLDSKKYPTKPLSGSNVNHPPGEFTDFFSNYNCTYEFIYNLYEGVPIASIARTGETVGVCIPRGNGNIIILPNIELSYQEGEDQDDRAYRIFQTFEELDAALKKRGPLLTPSNIPEWTKSYLLGSEKQELAKLRDLEAKAYQIEQQINDQKTVLSMYQDLKMLLFESGKNLEAIAEEVFKSFGYEILPTEHNRDDLIIKHKDDFAVIEIKGVNGSAAEKQAAQLQKWVTEYHINHDHQPKGILIVNTFRDKPLSDRTELDFPNQMMKYCNRQELCLLTSRQLLELILGFESDELTFEKIHELLFTTVGVLELPSSYIEKIDKEGLNSKS